MRIDFFFHFMVLVLLILGFTTCKKADPTDCFRVTGDDVTESREAGKYYKIVLNDNVNLIITQDTFNSIEVTAGEKLIKKVTTRIEDSVLYISNENTCNWIRSFDREIIANVVVKNLSRIEYRGSGDIQCSNAIVGDSLQLDIWEGAGKIEMEVNVHRNSIFFHIGTADVYYSGHAHLSYIGATSFGPVDAREMKTQFTYILNGGSNNCWVNADLYIGAEINSIGNIYYYGNPETSVKGFGPGTLIKLD